MPSLENLPLKDFKDLLVELGALDRAADVLEDAGLEPMLHLAPGEIMSLSIATAMPEACDAHADLFGPVEPAERPVPDEEAEGKAFVQQTLLAMGTPWSRDDDAVLLRAIESRPFQVFSDYSAELAAILGRTADATWHRMYFLTDPLFADYRKTPSPPPEQTPADAPPVADEGAAGGAAAAFTFAAGADPDHPDIVFQPADVLQTEAREKPLPDGQSPAEEGGGEAGSSPATASETSEKPTWNIPWTDEHQDELVEGMAHAILKGKAFTAAAHSMADELGRSGQACFMRAHQRLRPRIEARIAELKARPPSSAPAPSTPGPDSAVMRHIDDLPRLTHGRRWTEAEDADLLRCVVNGMKLPEISADLQLDAGKIKARIAELTRRFDAATMLAALEARLPQAAE